MTEVLAQLEGLERGPAGNTSLAAAFAMAQEMDQDQIIIVQETEYTGAGKHIQPQLSFARDNGIEVKYGNPQEEVPGQTIIMPEHPRMIQINDLDMDKIRKSLIKNAVKQSSNGEITQADLDFLIEDTRTDKAYVMKALDELGATVK